MKLANILPKISKKGQALIVVYMLIATFLIISGALLSKAITEQNLSLRHKLTTEAFYLAEGGAEDAISTFTRAIANFQIPADIQNFNRTTTFSTFAGATVTTSITRLEASDRIVAEGDTDVFVRNYAVSTTAIHPENNSISVTVHQIIARKLTPTFQYFIFYDNDLEILPGPNMTLTGKVHSNNDIYMDSDNTLTIDSFYVQCAGDIYNRRKDSSAQPNGDVSIRVTKPGAPAYELMDGLDSTSPNWISESTARWNGTVRSAAHGITKRTAPSVGSIQPDGYYSSQADIKIVNDELIKGGQVLTENIDYPVGAISTSNTLYNAREDKYIETVNIDLKKLAGYAPGDPPGNPSFSNNLPSDGLLYATKGDASPFSQPGIRLINGQEIYRNGGLTVVSNDPIYIQGDYNTVSGKPACVICDSLNILSNKWNDSNKSPGALPKATSTTVNCAAIAGVDTTTSGDYNGGLENYPRLHENWSGKQLSIKGSFVSLWESSIATGEWVYGSPQYTAPVRKWEYDETFNNMTNLPPFTPMAIEAERIAWWKD